MRAGDLIDDRFEIETRVGAGAMGSVYRAIDRRTGARVALKTSPGEELSERFIREARVIASLSHPAVVRYTAHGALPSGELYLAMDWLDGEDLARRLRRAALSPGEAVMLASRVADGLAAAHALGIVHRDVKPGNIFLPGGDVSLAKIIDFGAARISSGLEVTTLTGVIIGTPGYMAPEQAKGLPAIDARADVFSLGCVLYHCLAGRAPFGGDDLMAVLAKLLLEEPAPLSALPAEIPEALSELVARMMAKEPSERLPNGAAVARALEEIDLSSRPSASEWRRARGEAGDPEPRKSSPGAGEGESSGDLSPEGDPLAPDEIPCLAPSSQPAEALTLSEQRVVSVVLAAGAGNKEARAIVAPEIERLGGRLDALADGSMLVTIWGPGSAVDRAERAARCATAIHAHFAGARVYMVTGRGVVSSRVVEGDVIDRGVRAVRSMPRGAICADDVTASMLGPRFVIEPDGNSFILRGERHLRETASLLLGKPTPCMGRSRELSMIEGIFTSSVEEPQAGAVLVTGPAGGGKSRLRREFIEKVRRRGGGVEILMGRADSFGESSPLGPIADAIRDTAGIWGVESIESRRQKLAQRLRRHLSGERLARVTAFLGELIRAPFPDEEHRALRVARENAQLMGDAMRAAWEDWLTAECEAQPVVIILEDLHWADAATIPMIDATLRNLRDLPLMVLVLARPEIYTRFPGIWADRDVQMIKLGPLSRKVSEQLVRGALGKDAAPDVVTRIVERADGNPFYLEELIRAVDAGRGDAFPDSVLGTVEARLDAEGAEAKRILRAASVFGARFTVRGVAALLGGDELQKEAGGWLSVLASRELIAPDGDLGAASDPGYVFRHTLVREAAYATLTEADRSLGHRLAGAWLEQIDHPDATAMAEHFHRGGEPARALRWYLRAAEQALEASDLAAAIERAERGVASGAAGEDKGLLRLIQAEAHVWRGELGPAEERGAESAALLAAGSAAWFRAVAQVVLAAGKSGDGEHVERWVDPVKSAVPAVGALSAQVICLSWCATYLIFTGRYDAGDALLSALEPTPALDAEATAMIQQTRSIRASAAGDPGACLTGLEAALAAFEQAGDERNVCATRANLGFVLAELGDYDGAEQALRSALSTATRMDVHNLSMVTLHNLGHVLAYRGNLDEARRLEQQAVDAFQREGDSRILGLAQGYLAKIELLAGNLDVAEREARAAVKVLATVPPIRAGVLAVLARTLLAADRNEEALAAASEAFALLEDLGTIEEGEAMVRLVYAEALDANGQADAFREAITEARALLLARAAKISDPAWRERFLGSVADNAHTLALASRADARHLAAS